MIDRELDIEFLKLGKNETLRQDSEKAFADYVYLIGFNIASIAISFLTVKILTGILSTEKYGIIAIFLMVTQITSILVFVWTDTAYMRLGKEEFEEKDNLRKAFWTRIIIILPFYLIILFGAIPFRFKISDYIGIPQWGFWVLSLYMIIFTFNNIITQTFQIIRKIRTYGFLQVIEKVIYLLLLLLWFGMIDYGASPIYVIMILTITGLVMLIINCSRINITSFLPITVSRDFLIKFLTFSIPFILGTFSSYLGRWADLFLINHYLTKGDVGLYFLAFQLNSIFVTISISFGIAVSPRIIAIYTANRIDLLRKYFINIVPLAFLLWGYFLSLTFILLKWGFPILFNKDYNLALLPFSIFFIGTSFNILTVSCGSILLAYKKSWVIFRITVITSLIYLVGDLILIRQFGIKGATISACISGVFAGVWTAFAAAKELNINFRSILIYSFPYISVFILSQQGIAPSIKIFCYIGLALIGWVYIRRMINGEANQILMSIKVPLFTR